MIRTLWYAAFLCALILGAAECQAHADPAGCVDHGNGILTIPCPTGGTGAMCYEHIDEDYGPQEQWGKPVFTSAIGEPSCKNNTTICLPWCREYKPSPSVCSAVKLPRFASVWAYSWDGYQAHTFTATTPYVDQWLFPEDSGSKFNQAQCRYPNARLEAAGVGTFKGELLMAPLGGSSMLTGTLTDMYGGVFSAQVLFQQ